MRRRSAKTTLRFLCRMNNLVAIASSAPRERTSEIDYILRFGERQGNLQGNALKDYVDRIVSIYTKENPGVKIAHWNLFGRLYDPLFLRSELIDFLKAYARYPHVIVVITGLAEAVCPRGSIYSLNARSRYQEARDYIENLIVKRMPQSTHLKVLFT